MASTVVTKGVHGANMLCSLIRSAEHLVIFFVGDRMTERSISTEIVQLQDPVNICNIIARKFEEISQKSTIVVISPIRFPAFTAAIYDTFLPKLTSTGEPLGYNGHSFRASNQLHSLLKQANMFTLLDSTPKAASATEAATLPSIDVIGFSKGSIVLNQLLAEVAEFSSRAQDSATTIPSSAPLLRSLRHFHYVDAGLNTPGAYLTDPEVFSKLSTWCSTSGGTKKLKIVVHGTPRQWEDVRRSFLKDEKDRMVELCRQYGIPVRVIEYFGGQKPSLKMHFEILKEMKI